MQLLHIYKPRVLGSQLYDVLPVLYNKFMHQLIKGFLYHFPGIICKQYSTFYTFHSAQNLFLSDDLPDFVVDIHTLAQRRPVDLLIWYCTGNCCTPEHRHCKQYTNICRLYTVFQYQMKSCTPVYVLFTVYTNAYNYVHMHNHLLFFILSSSRFKCVQCQPLR